MGGKSSSTLHSFESEEAEGGVSVVNGIRLTVRVIDRMKESPKVVNQRTESESKAHSPVAQPVASLGEPFSSGECLVPILPHPPSHASSVVPPLLQTTEAVSVTPPSPTEPLTTTSPPVQNVDTPPSTTSELAPSVPSVTPAPPPAEALIPTVATEPIAIPVEPNVSPSPTATSAEPVSAPIATAPVSESLAVAEVPPSPDTQLTVPVSPVEELSSALAIPSEVPSLGQMGPIPSEEIPDSPPASSTTEPVVHPVLPSLTETITPITTSSKHAAVNEEELRRQIRAELQKQLQEEMKTAELKIQQQLEEEKAKAEAEAQAKARLQIQEQVQKVRESEQITLEQSLKDAVMKERMNTEDERLAAQHYWMERKVQKLEEKERDLAKQDSLYKEQIIKLEEKTAKFTKVTAESFKKGLDDARDRFKRHQIKPVCSELQSEILKCYRANTGQTLTCSNIASLYMQCVDNAKQNKKVSTGG